MTRNQKGFTLIELLIVVVIIGILAAIAIPKFSSAREKAYYSAVKSDLKNLSTQQEVYYSGGAYRYTDDLTALSYFPSKGVSLVGGAPQLNADKSGWSAAAVHDGLGNGTFGCAIYYGQNPPPVTVPGGGTVDQAGVVTCTGGV
ncbi:MAG TPA: prepilin-type N-terminal cleavage/methylation domain-containing protein [Longimicrobiales bacterium]